MTDNVTEFTGEWQGGSDEEMTDEEYKSAMDELLSQMEIEELSRTIAGVLEFLSVRALVSGPYYITPDDGSAVVVFAAEEDAAELLASLPTKFKSWEESSEDFLTDRDPGDEQDEPTA